LVVSLAFVGRALFLLGLGLVELGLDLRLDLVAKVDVALGLLALGGETVPMPEVAQLRGRHADLVGDPRISAPLAHPGADLVELRSERLPGHRRLTLVDPRLCLGTRGRTVYATHFWVADVIGA